MESQKISLKEKIGYALGDAGTNIAWRTMSTFLLIFYTDVYGLPAAAAGILLLITRLGDGITDIIMGIVGDRTKSDKGKFRPWILYTAVPFGLILALTFTIPPLGVTGKIVYAYITYNLYTLIYTANNVPYGALMGVMTSDEDERTTLSSFRFAGAYFGGILTQGLLIYFVLFFGNTDKNINVVQLPNKQYEVTILANESVESAAISMKSGQSALFLKLEDSVTDVAPTNQVSFKMEEHKTYKFHVSDIEKLKAKDIQIIDQKQGYQKSVYLLSALLVGFLLITYYTTRERVKNDNVEQSRVKDDLKDLFRNKPWLILLFIGFVFCIYNGIKQGVTVMYFKRYLHDESLSAIYMVALLVMSGIAALVTTPLVRLAKGKKNLFIYVMIFSAITNAMIYFAGDQDYTLIFVMGVLSEFGAGIMPVLFFAMLGDCADYSEWKNGRRATGLIFSAGTFAFKFGGGIAGAIIGSVLSSYHYDGLDETTIAGAIPAIKVLMSWLPAVILLVLGVTGLFFYTLTPKKIAVMKAELEARKIA